MCRKLKEEQSQTRTRIQTAANSKARMFLTEEDLITEEAEAEEDLEETNPALHRGPCPDDLFIRAAYNPQLHHMYIHHFNSIYLPIHFFFSTLSLVVLQRPNKLALFVRVNS